MKTLLPLLLFCFLFGKSQQNFSFDGQTIVALSDADMAATAFADGQLKKKEGASDQFMVISLDKSTENIQLSQIPVPNSVLTWPKVLELSKDGKTAFVAETRQSPMDGIQKVEDVQTAFPSGRSVYAMSIEGPSIATVVDVGTLPNAIKMSHSGKTLAVVTEQFSEEIVLIEWENGFFGKMQVYPHGYENVRATDISWHPSDQFLAVTLEERQEVVFYKIVENEAYTLVETWGTPVKVGKLPGAGYFSPDGKHYIIPNLNDWVTPGEMVVISFDEAEGNHTVASRLTIGSGPEGFAISPDGKTIAVACTNGTFFPDTDPKWNPQSELYLLNFDPNTAQLTVEDVQSFLGVLPQSIIFDADGNALAVSVYQYYDLTEQHGGIDFWNIKQEGGKKKLEKSIYNATLPSGCHALKLIK